jgi:lysine 6-dehydrogenase
MGRIVVRDLAETAAADVEIVVGDRDRSAARRAAAATSGRARVVEIDATDPRRAARALAGTDVIINACHHALNLRVMDAALAIGSHYCDLGGLFHVTRQQLQRHAEFKRAGLLALCGIGSAPGIVNVMARAAADRLDRVREIHVSVAGIDRTRRNSPQLLETSYSILTVLDEATLPAALFTRGRLIFVEALSQPEAVTFPAPVGRQYPACTLHSELATLPASFRRKGVREVSFRIAFPGGLLDRLRFVHGLGLADTAPIETRGQRVVPRDVLLALLSRVPRRDQTGPADEYEILRVTARGTHEGRDVEEVWDCHSGGMPAWGIGVDIDTGAPPSIAAQLLLAGDIAVRGVLPPERAIPVEPFLEALTRRTMKVTRRRKSVARL